MRTISLIFLVNLATACVAPAEDGGDAPGGDVMPSTTPAELEETSWTWITSAGAQQLGFDATGGYTSFVYLDAHPGESCGTEYFTSRAGRVTFAGATVTMTSRTSTREKVDSCSDRTLEEVAIDQDTSTYGWRLEGADTIILVDENGNEWSYDRD